MSDTNEFDRWLKLFNEHGEHNRPLTKAAAKVHDGMRLAIASARTLMDPNSDEGSRDVTPEIWAAARDIYDRTAAEERGPTLSKQLFLEGLGRR